MADRTNTAISSFPQRISSGAEFCIPDAHGRCLTCSDDAVQVTVLRVKPGENTAVVMLDGQPTEIDISLVDQVNQGDVLLVHGGVALEKRE